MENFLRAKCATFSGSAKYQNTIQILSDSLSNMKYQIHANIWIKHQNHVGRTVPPPKLICALFIQKADGKKHYSGCINPKEESGKGGEGSFADHETGWEPIHNIRLLIQVVPGGFLQSFPCLSRSNLQMWILNLPHRGRSGGRANIGNLLQFKVKIKTNGEI